MNRREALKSLLSTALQAAGAVVVARSAVQTAQGQTSAPRSGDVRKRADQLACEGLDPATEECGIFLNFNPFRNGFNNGGFHNGGFHNHPFHNGGFGNGGFSNGGFRNTPFNNFPFDNFPFDNHFHNGGFRNGGFRNSPFRNGGFLNF